MVVLYTTHCPKCKVLEAKLKQKNIEYSECSDIQVMEDKGIMSVPFLQTEDQLLPFSEAIKWVNAQ